MLLWVFKIFVSRKRKKKKNKKINYIYTEDFKTLKENLSRNELKDIFNRKFYKTIMKIEKSSGRLLKW